MKRIEFFSNWKPMIYPILFPGFLCALSTGCGDVREPAESVEIAKASADDRENKAVPLTLVEPAKESREERSPDAASPQEGQEKGALIVFDEDTYHFGKVKAGDQIELGGSKGQVLSREREFATLRMESKPEGTLPLPPYFHGDLESPDRYQTIFSDQEGAVAAPTAGTGRA